MARDSDFANKRGVRCEAASRPLSSEQNSGYLTDLNQRLRTPGSLFDYVGWKTECVLGILYFLFITVHAYAAEDPKQALEAIVKAGGIYNIDEDDPARPVVEVMLQGPKFTDVDLAHVAAFPKLKYLPLGGSHISDAGLAHLKDLKDLENLYLTMTTVKGDGLVHLRALQKLNCLDLDYCPLADEPLKHIASLKALRGLNLNQTPISDKGLAQLSGAKSLTHLYLAGTKLTDDGLAHLRHLSELQTLVLSETRITDQGLKHLYGLKKLLSVVADGTAVTDRGAADLRAQLPELTIGYKSNERQAAAGRGDVEPTLNFVRFDRSTGEPYAVFSFCNVTGGPIFFYGYGALQPLQTWERHEKGKWIECGRDWCGTGSSVQRLPVNGELQISVRLKKYRAQDMPAEPSLADYRDKMRLVLYYGRSKDDIKRQVRSGPFTGAETGR